MKDVKTAAQVVKQPSPSRSPVTATPTTEEKQPESVPYRDQSIQQRMSRPTPEQQRSGGRSGGETIEGETPVDKKPNP